MANIGPTNELVINGTSSDDSIIGGSTNQIINGLGGNDRLSGLDGNDSLFGGSGNDTVMGGAGRDTLVGVNRFSTNPGLGEIDRLTGNSGSDTFVLGDINNVYYDDDNLFTTGTNDYALITDFQSGQDTIQLKGGVNYRLENVNLVGGISGRGIYVDNAGFLPDELVGVIQGIQPFTALNINNGPDITTITGLGFSPIV